MSGNARWHTESSDAVEKDALTGVGIYRLTGAPVISNNIYGEEPFCSGDGTRFAFIRHGLPSAGFAGYDATSLWVCDLSRRKMPVTRVEESILPCTMPGCAKYKGTVYYQRLRGGRRELAKLSLDTLATEPVFDLDQDRLLEHGASLVSATTDGRYYVAVDITRKPQRCRIVRLDLARRQWAVIHENTDIINPHLQISPANHDILIQHNQGALLGAEPGHVIRSFDSRGIALYVIDMDGGHPRRVPLGRPHTHMVTGHQAWIGHTGEILATVHVSDRSRKTQPRAEEARERTFRTGKLFAARPGDKAPRVVTKGYPFGHISVSMDGKYYVGDAAGVPGCPLIIGSIETGRAMIACLAGGCPSNPQFTHAHPYFTADNRWIIFNSDKTGIPQIYGARIPEYFFAALT